MTFRLIKLFIELLNFSGSVASMAHLFNFTTFVSLNNQPCMNRPTLIGLNGDE